MPQGQYQLRSQDLSCKAGRRNIPSVLWLVFLFIIPKSRNYPRFKYLINNLSLFRLCHVLREVYCYTIRKDVNGK
jgi:hypothetical protein